MNVITWLNVNSGASQVILAGALVSVTIYYAIQTRKTTKILEQQVDTDVKPIVVLDHSHVPEDENDERTLCVLTHLTNIGTGVAININADFSYADGGTFVGKSVNAIDFIKPSGEQSSHHLHIEKSAFQHLRYLEGHHGLAAELICSISFQDIHGKSFKTQQMVYFSKENRKITPEPGTLKMA